MSRKSTLSFIIAMLFVSSCTRMGASGNPIQLPDGAASLGEPGSGQLVGEGGLSTLDAPPERPLYVLNATLDYAGGSINAQQRIEFLNPSGQDLTEIKFNVPPARRAGAVEFRDARIYGSDKSLQFALDNAVLTVKLPSSASFSSSARARSRLA